MPPPATFTGTFIHTPSLGSLEVLENKKVSVDEKGVISAVEDLVDGEDGDGEGISGVRRWWFPGFVDTHTHASQHPNCGLFGSTTLLDWLKTYTFPLESSLSDAQKAKKVYTRAVESTLRSGTTTAAYYATTHVPATKILADICHERGQRAFIGRCNMDSDVNESYYKDASPETAVQDTLATISHIRGIDPTHDLLSPIITPRFAPSCTTSLLSALGTMAQDRDLPIQTHISENRAEIELVRTLFPDRRSYADVYDHHSLLTPRTVLAHAVHLSPDERSLIKRRESKISHCPVSNTSLSSGLCPVRTMLDEGIDVGLGTDVSGGYSSSMLVAAREAGMVSRTLAGLGDGAGQAAARKKLSVEETLYLATRGGARCLGLEGRVGLFEVGREWDAQLIEVTEINTSAEDSSPATRDTRGGGNVELWGKETWPERIAKWVFCGDDRNTKKVYVKGRLVWSVAA